MLKKIFLKTINNLTEGENEIGVALSSGVDSNSILFSLLELGKKVTSYSFHIDGVNSTDFLVAKTNSDIFKVPFKEVIIPKIIDKDKVIDFISKYSFKKTKVECIYPYYFLLPEVKEKILLIGLGADDHFCLSKKGMIHYRTPLNKLQEFRLINREDTIFQLNIINSISKEKQLNISIKEPFSQPHICKYFFDKSWNEINKPKQKQPLLDMFPEYFSKIKIYLHQDLQCGDTKIRELFIPLLNDRNLNNKNRTRIIDLYRDIYIKEEGLNI